MRRELLPRWMPDTAFLLGWVGRNQWRKQIWLLYKVLNYLRSGKYLICQECCKVSLMDWNPLLPGYMNQANGVVESRPGYQYDRCGHCGSRKIRPAEPLPDVFLWLHMPSDDPGIDWPVRWLEHQFDLKPGRDLYYTEGCGHLAALAPRDMPMLYQLWDLLLYLSGGEGFGLPPWEAMCCGLPVVYTNYSSHAEFLTKANAGLPVGGILQREPISCVWRMVADVPQTIEAVRNLYYDRAACKRLGTNGLNFVQDFKPEMQSEKWHQIFQRLRNDAKL